jgi:hypothetical protein
VDQNLEDIEFNRVFDFRLIGVSQQDIANLADGLDEMFRPENWICDTQMCERLKPLYETLCKASQHAYGVVQSRKPEAANDSAWGQA